MTHETVEQAIYRGVKITYLDPAASGLDPAASGLDPLTGMPKRHAKAYQESSKRGAKQTKTGRPVKAKTSSSHSQSCETVDGAK